MVVMYLLTKDVLNSRIGKRITLLLTSSISSAVEKGLEAVAEARDNLDAKAFTRTGD
jgi:hypothetical protein